MSTIFVYEMVTGGGIENGPLVQLLSEGYAMLFSVLSDCLRAGMKVKTVVDERVAPFLHEDLKKIDPNYRNFLEIGEVAGFKAAVELFDKYTNSSDRVLIIAPESDNLLYFYTVNAEKIGHRKNIRDFVIGPGTDFIEMATDKTKTAEFFEESGIPTVPAYNPEDPAAPVNMPVVVKPKDGVGAEWTYIMDIPRFGHGLPDNPFGIYEELLKREGFSSSAPDYIVQPFISGIPISISVINGCGKPCFIGFNLQRITAERINYKFPVYSVRYDGGFTPIKMSGKLLKEIGYIVERICDAYPFSGYFGIDAVITSNKVYGSESPPTVLQPNPPEIPADYDTIFFIEINPRLTTPVAAYSRLFSDFNLNFISLVIKPDSSEGVNARGVIENCGYGYLYSCCKDKDGNDRGLDIRKVFF